ncbi:hypothetical protein BT67DRAFT_417536 [Trichocladium antarcticum]|uniref:Uncharacterized protein n=1 Tax=Trichocladium antarcticum TaxID=1450529 RepID=A0AAN6UQ90_9PEZI|nr:hypothetical protein BT67DRAFT_417536 [Trichocladium antarcticum]
MGTKRHYNALAGDENPEPVPFPSNKRRREQQNKKEKDKHLEGKPDPTYGQRAAFPGLDDDEPGQIIDDDLEYEEDFGALAYLKAVRQEASGVPNVLVAPKAGPQLRPHLEGPDNIDRSIYDDGVGDSRGYYHDGAYTAAPSPSPSPTPTPPSEEGEHLTTDPDSRTADQIASHNAALRNAYYASLTNRFLSLRALLHQTPPDELVTALPRENGTFVGSFGAKSWTFGIWTKRIRHTDPLPVQVAALDRQSVLKLLRVILGGKFVRRGYELRERTSRWLWALLARLPDQGEMDHTEVGWVRELGKRAVLMMVSIAQMAALKEEVEGVDSDEEEEDEKEHVGEMVIDDGDEHGGAAPAATATDVEIKPASTGAASAAVEPEPEKSTSAPAASNNNEREDGEMDMDIEDGETSDHEPIESAGNKDIEADIAAAKARLLAQLGEAPNAHQDEQQEEPMTAANSGVDEQEGEEPAVFDEAEAWVNMRATLNMILTVAGEFYGQRDLLEFRDPFPAL